MLEQTYQRVTIFYLLYCNHLSVYHPWVFPFPLVFHFNQFYMYQPQRCVQQSNPFQKLPVNYDHIQKKIQISYRGVNASTCPPVIGLDDGQVMRHKKRHNQEKLSDFDLPSQIIMPFIKIWKIKRNNSEQRIKYIRLNVGPIIQNAYKCLIVFQVEKSSCEDKDSKSKDRIFHEREEFLGKVVHFCCNKRLCVSVYIHI